jgi:AAA+ superfamily predicted ATPase
VDGGAQTSQRSAAGTGRAAAASGSRAGKARAGAVSSRTARKVTVSSRPAARKVTGSSSSPGALRSSFQRLDAILGHALRQARERFGAEASADSFRGLYVTAEQAAAALAGPPGIPLLDGTELNGATCPDLPDWNQLTAAHPGWRWLKDSYGLTDQELDVVLIGLAPDADLRYERLYGYLQDDVTRRRPTVNLTLDLITTSPDDKLAARAVFRADAPLLAGRLVRLVPDPQAATPPLLAHIVAVDEQVVDVLLFQGGLDRTLASYCQLVHPPPGHWPDVPLPDSERDQLLAAAVRAVRDRHPLRVHFLGRGDTTRQAAAQALAGELHLPLLILDLSRLPAEAAETDEVLLRLFREATLHQAVLYLDNVQDLLPGGSAALAVRLADDTGVVIMAGHKDWVAPAGPPLGVLEISFLRPGPQIRRSAWAASLSRAGITPPDGLIETLADRFRCGPGQIADAVASAVAHARAAGTEPGRPELFAAARSQSTHLLSALATKITPAHRLSDLVLPADSMTQLDELCQRVILREQVWRSWGPGRPETLGRGTIALFSGPPGTGKTMAAEVVAAELGLDLFKIDLSAMVSKYIGETEKNLEQIFTAAADTDTILLFDEADALFGKRSEVRDSHDRYANIEISYLLQRMERYDGVAILATNLREHLDEAFTRRLQFVIGFPFPGDLERSRIWEICLPSGALRGDDVDVGQLGRDFRLSGGNIRNAAVHAAFLAAAADSTINLNHLRQAVAREHYKMGKITPGAHQAGG